MSIKKAKATSAFVFLASIFLAFNASRAEEDPAIGEDVEQKVTQPKPAAQVVKDIPVSRRSSANGSSCGMRLSRTLCASRSVLSPRACRSCVP